MRTVLLMLAGVALAAPIAVTASNPTKHSAGETAYISGGGMPYAVFEESIDHVDVETCPVEFDPDAVFCRMTLANNAGHIFVFSYDDDQPLLAVKPVHLDAEMLRL